MSEEINKIDEVIKEKADYKLKEKADYKLKEEINKIDEVIKEKADYKLKEEINGSLNLRNFDTSNIRIKTINELRLYEVIEIIKEQIFEFHKFKYREKEKEIFLKDLRMIKEYLNMGGK